MAELTPAQKQAMVNAEARLRQRPNPIPGEQAPAQPKQAGLTPSRTAGLAARGAAPVLAGAALGAGAGAMTGPAAPVAAPALALAGSVALPIGDVLMWAAQKMGALEGRRSPSEVVSEWMTELGLPEPQNTAERMITAGGSAIGGAGSQIAAAAKLAANVGPGAVRTAANALKARPTAQMTAAAPAGATAQGVTEATDNPLLGMAAGTAVGAGVPSRRVPQGPTRPQLAQAADDAYRSAWDAGVVIKGDEFQNFVQRAEQSLIAEGYSPLVQPKTAGVLATFQKVAEAGKPMGLQEVEQLRRVARKAAKSPEPAEVEFAERLIDEIDDFIDGLTPAQLAAGDPKAATAALNAARVFWTRNKRAEVIETAIDRAKNRAETFGPSGMENALRIEFRQIAQNPKRLKQFSKEEQRAIKAVARGGTVQNVLRYFGKLAPFPSLGGTLVSGSLGAQAGYMLSGDITGAALAAGGLGLTAQGSKYAAERMGRAGVDRLDDMVRSGRPVPRAMMNPTMPTRGALSGLPTEEDFATEEELRRMRALAGRVQP